MRALKIVSIILGILFALAGIVLITGAGFGLGAYNSQRDASGFFNTPSRQVGSYGFVLTVPDINQQLGPSWARWVPTHAQATIRITGTSELTAPLFIGIGSTSSVSRYVSGVTRDRIKGIDLSAGTVQYDHVDGTTIPSKPGRQSFWVAKTEGVGTRTLEWDLEPGDWTVVFMNGDASPPVAATVLLGVKFGVLTKVLVSVLAGGVALLAIGAALIALGVRRRLP